MSDLPGLTTASPFPRPLRIIVVMLEPPLAFGDAAARWFHVLLRGLTERGHQITAFAACSKPAQAAEARAVFPSPQYDLRCYGPSRRAGVRARVATLREPYSYVLSEELRQDLAAELERPFDVLHLEQLWTGWLGLSHASRALLNLHYLFSIDLAGESHASPRQWVRWQITRRAERRLLRSYPRLMALTPELAQAAGKIAPRSTVHTLPLSLDLSLYPFRAAEPSSTAPTVSLIANFSWEPNQSAVRRLVERLWPAIKNAQPDARLRLVGRHAHQLRAWVAGMPDVEVHSDVPDAKPYFDDTHVLLYAPQRASGMKVKILEAFALGAAVVTTPDGVEGLPAEDGIHAGVCIDDAGLVSRTLALLRDPDARHRQENAARRLVETCCAPDVVLAKLERIYQQILSDGSARDQAAPVPATAQ